MHGIGDLARELSFKLDRKRNVLENGFEFGDRRKKLDDSPERSAVDELAARYSDLMSKARDLGASIDRVSSTLSIPVSESARHVAAAVRRRDPGNDGSSISYDLWKRARAYRDKARRANTIQFMSKAFTGDPLTDSMSVDLNERVFASDGEMGKQDFLFAGSMLGVLVLLHKLMAGFQANQTGQIVGGKFPFGTEVGPVIAQIALSVFYMQLFSDQTRDELSDAISAAFGEQGITEQDIKSAAITQPGAPNADDRVQQMHMRYKEKEDWSTITEYARNWITRNVERRGYEGWAHREDVEEIEYMIEQIGGEMHRYTDVAQGVFNPFPSQDELDDAMDAEARRRSEFSPIPIDKDQFNMFDKASVFMNESLNNIAILINTDYGTDLVCCFTRWAGQVDKSLLERLRTLLYLFVNGINMDTNRLMNTFLSSTNSALFNSIMVPLMNELHEFFTKIIDPILEWLNTDNEDWRTAFACTPIDEMAEYLVGAIEEIERLLLSLMQDLWDDITLRHTNLGARIKIGLDKGYGQGLLNLIDAVLDALNRGELCAEDDTGGPAPEEIRDFVNNFVSSSPPKYDLPIPTSEGSRFREFKDFDRLVSKMGFDAPVPDFSLNAQQRASVEVTTEDVVDCFKRIPTDKVVPFEVFSKDIIEELKNVRSGSV